MPGQSTRYLQRRCQRALDACEELATGMSEDRESGWCGTGAGEPVRCARE